MDQIIDKLSEIEIAASRILESAANQKKILDQQQEERIAAYDRELEASTARQVAKLQSQLSAQLNQELSQLRGDAEKNLKELDCYYEKNHNAVSTEIYEKIIRK